jgi:hypothetical protein
MTLDRPFLAFVDGDGREVFINTLQIRHATFSPSGVDIIFSEAHTIHFDGIAALTLVTRLTEIGTALNGEPLSSPRDIQPLTSTEDPSPEA